MKLRVGILFGGESVEHEVSIISALQAMAAMDSQRYDIVPIYISKQRDFYTSPMFFDVEPFQDLELLKEKAENITLVKKGQQVVMEPVKKSWRKKDLGTLDVIIPVMHGTNGEDGTIQGYLEMLKIPYAAAM